MVLVGCGPSVNIHEAAYDGNPEAVKQHLAAGADVYAKDKIVGTPLHAEARNGHKETAKLLITKGADMNANSDDYGTPLDWAIHGRQAETIYLLRKHGGKTGEELKAEGK